MSISISVIIPTYKPADYLRKCLESLSFQTLSFDKFEVILVLNGCSDPYITMIQGLLDKMPHGFHCTFFHTVVPGVSNARNIGIEHALGDYIAFVDDDDFISPTYLEELLQSASKDTVAISNELLYLDDLNEFKKESFSYEFDKKSHLGKQHYQDIRKFFSGPCMKLIHRDMIASYRFDTRFSNGEDSLFMFAMSANIKYVAFTSPEAVYYRRKRSGSAMSMEASAKRMIKNRCQMIVAFVRIYLRQPSSYSFNFLVTRILGCLHSIWNSL